MTEITHHRVLCFGGRAYVQVKVVEQVLDQLPAVLRGVPFAIFHGGAPGADVICGAWGKRHGHPVASMEANWDFYGKPAGPIRNQWMLDFFRPTYAVGFPGGPGTRDMLARLDLAGVPCWKIN